MKRHLILVGLSGSGKTTVGRSAAKLLPTDFTDVDEVIEQEAGRTVLRIFAESGEAEFRRLERAVMDRALRQPPHLIAAGGGWIAQPGNLEAAQSGGACIVYLRVFPATAARRLSGDGTRPLLGGGDPTERLAALLAERERWYARAEREVNAEAAPSVVAAAVAAVARQEAGT